MDKIKAKNFLPLPVFRKKNSSRIKPHTAVVVCCAVGFAAKRSPTTRREHELEISKAIPVLDNLAITKHIYYQNTLSSTFYCYYFEMGSAFTGKYCPHQTFLN